MHIVVKGSWVRSSLGNAEQWVTSGQAMVPPPPLETHTHVHRLLGATAENQSRISDFTQLQAFAVMSCTHL